MALEQLKQMTVVVADTGDFESKLLKSQIQIFKYVVSNFGKISKFIF